MTGIRLGLTSEFQNPLHHFYICSCANLAKLAQSSTTIKTLKFLRSWLKLSTFETQFKSSKLRKFLTVYRSSLNLVFYFLSGNSLGLFKEVTRLPWASPVNPFSLLASISQRIHIISDMLLDI